MLSQSISKFVLGSQMISCREDTKVQVDKIHKNERIAGRVDLKSWNVSEWRTCRLGDLGSVTGGGTPSRDRAEYRDGPIPLSHGSRLVNLLVAALST